MARYGLMAILFVGLILTFGNCGDKKKPTDSDSSSAIKAVPDAGVTDDSVAEADLDAASASENDVDYADEAGNEEDYGDEVYSDAYSDDYDAEGDEAEEPDMDDAMDASDSDW